jgi:hypothetical protein
VRTKPGYLNAIIQATGMWNARTIFIDSISYCVAFRAGHFALIQIRPGQLTLLSTGCNSGSVFTKDGLRTLTDRPLLPGVALGMILTLYSQPKPCSDMTPAEKESQATTRTTCSTALDDDV